MREVEGSPRHRMTAGESPKGRGASLSAPLLPLSLHQAWPPVCLAVTHIFIYIYIYIFFYIQIRQIYSLFFVFSLQENIQENIIQNLIQEIQTTLAKLTFSDEQILYASIFLFHSSLLQFFSFFFGWGQIRLNGLPLFVSVCFFFFFFLKCQALKDCQRPGLRIIKRSESDRSASFVNSD